MSFESLFDVSKSCMFQIPCSAGSCILNVDDTFWNTTERLKLCDPERSSPCAMSSGSARDVFWITASWM